MFNHRLLNKRIELMRSSNCSVVEVPKRDAANHFQGNINAREEGSESIREFIVKILIRDGALRILLNL